ncbi:GNAT family N-acetyltransferase [Lysobacter sp. BMK333-48F3]|uniref:GNAT family N-acetyltransferase n=1 Tax=Lysobacter sp. BMK333-48F3 TaxID=2867962 RepID=UPI001C8B31A2|nr:GNAT family N-acetyltransferase [Lysobacter sp. BMK333-48F3]MBX9402581.1 GNAT family N-acetyltransferase [Lysobacter sp. BMK333-48F3]
MDAQSDAWTRQPRLSGEHVALEPLRREHGDGLRAALAGGELAQAWYTNVPAPAGVDGYIDAALAMRDRGQAWPFAVLDARGEVVGSTRYYDMDATVPRLQIGYTFYAPRVQRTGLNTQAKRLLLGHAFETLGCIAVGFETSWFNQASRTAIARLGAKQDGVLRNHRRHADGSPRDTVAFSIIDTEWPAVKRNLQYKLDRHASGAASHD